MVVGGVDMVEGEVEKFICHHLNQHIPSSQLTPSLHHYQREVWIREHIPLSAFFNSANPVTNPSFTFHAFSRVTGCVLTAG
jgi:hypothetical protein